MPPLPTSKAPKTYEELKELLRHDTKVKVAGTPRLAPVLLIWLTCAGVDVDGVLRGKFMSKDKFLSVAKPDAGFGFCSVVFGWDSELPTPRNSSSSMS
jgi:glutamine synthetase